MSELLDETGFLKLVVDQQCSFDLEEVHQQALEGETVIDADTMS